MIRLLDNMPCRQIWDLDYIDREIVMVYIATSR